MPLAWSQLNCRDLLSYRVFVRVHVIFQPRIVFICCDNVISALYCSFYRLVARNLVKSTIRISSDATEII